MSGFPERRQLAQEFLLFGYCQPLAFQELRHLYLHHIDEEEEEMFPDADRILSAAVEKGLAETFEERKPDELERALKA